MGAVQQLLYQVEWGELDVMVIDMPPGTGDAHLTVTQRVPVSGNIIISSSLNQLITFSPSPLSLICVRLFGVNRFEKSEREECC
jgi:hypothetical protein